MLMKIYRPKTKKGKIALFLLVLLIAAAVYFFFFRNSGGEFKADPRDPHADTIAANTLNCGLSVPAGEGKYYISGTRAIKKGNLNYSQLEGEKIKIIGYVYEGEDKDTKIANAKIEAWQADSAGVFHPPSGGKADEFDKEQLALRGSAVADEFGYYEFTTIYPGESEGRVRHIYIKASADGYESLATQLVMSRSGDLASAYDDPVALELPNCNAMHFAAWEGVQTAAYDFHLVSAPPTQTAGQ
jgi:protocatechuate 3,4-dioxygenase beta subunit